MQEEKGVISFTLIKSVSSHFLERRINQEMYIILHLHVKFACARKKKNLVEKVEGNILCEQFHNGALQSKSSLASSYFLYKEDAIDCTKARKRASSSN